MGMTPDQLCARIEVTTFTDCLVRCDASRHVDSTESKTCIASAGIAFNIPSRRVYLCKGHARALMHGIQAGLANLEADDGTDT